MGLTIDNILDLSIWRRRFKQLHVQVQQTQQSEQGFSLQPAFISSKISHCGNIAIANFRQDNSEISFDSKKIRECFDEISWRNFVEFSREQRTKNTEFRLHFFCKVL